MRAKTVAVPLRTCDEGERREGGREEEGRKRKKKTNEETEKKKKEEKHLSATCISHHVRRETLAECLGF